jgi:hypothetical protein
MENYSMKHWEDEYKNPMTKDYQPSNAEFAGQQPGKTLEYVPRTEKINKAAASKVKSMQYHGRYE